MRQVIVKASYRRPIYDDGLRCVGKWYFCSPFKGIFLYIYEKWFNDNAYDVSIEWNNK